MVPNQGEDLILGNPWLIYHHAELFPALRKLHFNLHDVDLLSDEHYAKQKKSQQLQVAAIPGSVYAAMAKRSARNQTVQLFSATLADIERALAPKVKLTTEEIIQKLPPHYRHLAEAFDPQEASKLPPHRPGICQGTGRRAEVTSRK